MHVTVPLARSQLSDIYRAIRNDTLALAAPLSSEDCCAQSMPEASPVKWHLAHTSWFFETFILELHESAFAPFNGAYHVLFNSYYNGIGEQHARAQRGLLTRPSLNEVREYRTDVDRRILQLLESPALADQLLPLIELGLQHEQQHQELIRTDLKHLLFMNPLAPAYDNDVRAVQSAPRALTWRHFEAGIVHLGHTGEGFCFDNELPCHRQFVEAYAIASRLVTNQEYLAFIDAGGYRNAALWLSEGWDWVCRLQLQQPLYWQKSEAGWLAFTDAGMQPLDLHAAVIHVSYFEADAYARWAGARLPTEAEWENAADADLAQLYDTAWQWTASSYAAYPGYAIAPGALGEYNGKFMSNQFVLRGGSQATPAAHTRRSYRNFFPASARWQYAGIRLAR